MGHGWELPIIPTANGGDLERKTWDLHKGCARKKTNKKNPTKQQKPQQRKIRLASEKTFSLVLYCPFIPITLHICVNAMMFLEFYKFLSTLVVTLSWFPILKPSLRYLSMKSFLFFFFFNINQLLPFFSPVFLCLIDKEFFTWLLLEKN